MQDVLVSVLTPCFNSVKTIEKTLECIEQQTYPDIEYIILDGGSTDGTLDIIEHHRAKLPKQFTLVSEKDNGIYDAMNKGIRQASGKLIGIVNSDDWYEKDTIENVVKAYQGNQYEVVYGMQKTYLNGKEKATFIYHHDFLPQQMITFDIRKGFRKNLLCLIGRAVAYIENLKFCGFEKILPCLAE